MSQWRKFANSHTQTVREPDDRTKLYVHAFQGHYSYRVIRDKKEIAKGSGRGSGFDGRQAADNALNRIETKNDEDRG